MTWTVERHVGDAGAFHARELPASVRKTVWWFEVDEPTLVLGSTQRDEVVDWDAARKRRVQVVRRRSGGGAVWLEPGAVTWVDVIIPAGDPLWESDVGRSSAWLGEVWVDVLVGLGVSGARIHRDPMAGGRDGGLVCFAGRAPGEVVIGGAKVVGISQRRARGGARFQCAVVHRWDPSAFVDLLVPDGGIERRGDLAERLEPVGSGIGEVSSDLVVAGLLTRLRAG